MRSILGLASALSLTSVGASAAAADLATLAPLLRSTNAGHGRPVRDYHKGEPRVASTHFTAKTHKGVPCVATRTAAAALPNRVARIQMLKDRAARRAERNAA